MSRPDLHVRTPPSTSSSSAEQPVSPELQGHHPCFPVANDYQHLGYQIQGPQYGAQGNLRAFDCPSIQITSIAPNNHVEPGGIQQALAVGGAEGGYLEASWPRDQLFLPLDPSYRDPALCPSPCSSLSSRSWMSDLSSCESFSNVCEDVEGELRDAARLALGSPLGSPVGSPGCGGGAFGVELWQQKYQHPSAFSPALSPHQSPRQSPCHSPRTSVTEESWLHRRPTSRPSSRPTSPCGKRRHSSADPRARSPSPSPHHSPSPTPGASPRGSVTDDTWVGSPAGAMGGLFMSGCYQELDVPSKTRRTSGSQLGDGGLEELRTVIPFQESAGGGGVGVVGGAEEAREQDGLAELFLQVPSHFSWNKPKPGNPPLFRNSSPPPLDCLLPSRFDQYELKLEVQPKSYHRAHYETEGSRGSIKALTGGHPLIKLSGYSEQPVSMLLFIGTADDRYLRPHCFYQVHRVTGKTVTTSCQEKIIEGTKVLEIPLQPENNMSASIDCAGILKLRNADIEMKKGETDIGRKNTRVRVVFRVALPQQGGRTLWLQTVSVPVECSQRSGQELPHVDSFSPTSCCVDGGDELLITGSNICPQSKVVFMEKGQDGRSLWEVDARVLPEKSSGSSIVVEIPPYNKKTTSPVQVQFYVSNGKRRRSLTHTFTYLPGDRRHLLGGTVAGVVAGATQVKQERWEPDHISHNAPGFCHDRALSPDLVYYDACSLPVHCAPVSQTAPRLHHPPHASLMFPHTSSSSSSSIPLHTSSSIPLHTSSSSIPLHTSSSIPLHTTSSIPLHTSSIPLHTSSSIPLHTSSIPLHTSSSSSIPLHTSSSIPLHTSSSSSSIPLHTSSSPSSIPLHTSSSSSIPLHTSSIPLHTSSSSSIPLHTSSIPLHTSPSSSIPLQSFVIPPQTSAMPPQTSAVPLQSFTIPPQPPASSSSSSSSSTLPPQTASIPIPPLSSSGGHHHRDQSSPCLIPGEPSSPPSLPPLSSPPLSLLSLPPPKDSRGALSIKQEPQEPNAGSLGLQEITLDDVNEIIDRDICSLSGVVQPDQLDQYHQYDWEHKSGDAALPFCGGPQ
ncbi:LOW QUALITY PROTEIN: nuclear factor of activated T-cells, cytoplasmic 3 [Scomber japonicus]|uniref:LOW QUALITY PROTEIN: nuclear factor of activated T-cells, cytoplasmic 3 n=1 Tax=Scomber japonicus TaxID=13676 RepID=UPI002306078A|nr:LOW QUALITY PROTEIN: nuclear factor of activated T-cells, cytoplasmic 3 [Scomber japonicus]